MRITEAIPGWLFLTIAFASPTTALRAADEHGHGVKGESTAAAFPRFAATSEMFELVGVLEGRSLTLYLDRAADNSPVKDAQLQLEVGGARVEVAPHGEGEFKATLAQPLKAGLIPVTATVIAGADTDLLAGELELQAIEKAGAAHVHSRTEYAAWIATAIAGIALLVWSARRALRIRQRRGIA